MRSFLWLAGLLLAAGVASADSKDSILARMDKAAPLFHGISADVQMVTYTAIFGDRTLEKGTLQMQKQGADLRAKISFTGGTDARTVAFTGKLVRIYYPVTNSYQDFDLGNNGNVLNQILLLGFGSSGRDLEKAYTIKADGVEKIAGLDTTRLQLIPRDPKVLEKLSKIFIWIPDGAAYPLRQQFFEPAGGNGDNYRLVDYAAIQLNPASQGGAEFKLPPHAVSQSK